MNDARAATTASAVSARHRPVIAVVGPTAVGKTALAEEIALRAGGEVVSADSMQIYRGMDIGTAKPPVNERRVPYHLLDVVEPGTPYSAALYQCAAREAIDDIHARGLVAVVAGGTGLYVRAALDDLDFPPGEHAGEGRKRLEELAGRIGAIELHKRLAEADPASAALIHPHNVRRTIRALEMAEQGVSYAEQAAGLAERRSYYKTTWVGLTANRARLWERVDARVDAMMAAGLLAEVEGLLEGGFREALTARQAIGYKELVSAIEGTAALEEAVAAIKQATRRYAKRQLTWFRADPRVVFYDVDESDSAHVINEVLSRLAALD